MNPEVDWFFIKASKWKQPYRRLRGIAMQLNLAEEQKWGCPCYTFNGKNVVLIHGFKDYCALLFMKGALLTDTKKLLVQPTTNVQAARQLRFTNEAAIKKLATTIKRYINEAIAIEKTGKQVVMKPTAAYTIPVEFAAALKEMPELKKAFESLTPGRQRGYLLYFTAAKQAATREKRISQYIPQILAGKGLND